MSSPGKTDEVVERQGWGHKSEFLLSCIGFAVGLGNVWRFPYLAQKNGGGAFLIPYFIMLFLEGIPLFYLELSIGQFFRCGPIPAWQKVSRFATGIGFAQAMLSFLIGLYYNVVIAWCIYYFFASWQSPLPWTNCPTIKVNNSEVIEPACKKLGSSSYYWYYETLQIGESMEDRSGINWAISLCLLCAWIIVVASMIKGIQSSGKVVYFTALFPYICLLIFFIRGLLLEGSSDGIKFLFTADWDRLKDANVWLDAAGQIFFSLSVGFGGLTAYASYNPVDSNTLRDTLIITFTNCATSVFAGVAIFSILGFRANNLFNDCVINRQSEINSTLQRMYINGSFPGGDTAEALNRVNVSKLFQKCDKEKFLGEKTGGTGLVFIAFTEAINQMPGSVFWALLFFLMLVTLGLDSMFGALEGLVTSLRDIKAINSRVRKELVILLIAFPSFFIGLTFCQYSGEYILQVFDAFTVAYPALVITICECLFICYVYGIGKFSADIKSMTGHSPLLLFKVMWMVISPLAITIISVAYIVLQADGGKTTYSVFNRNTYSTEKQEYPDWALALGIILTLISIVMIPIGALIGLIRGPRQSRKMSPVVHMNEYAQG